MAGLGMPQNFKYLLCITFIWYQVLKSYHPGSFTVPPHQSLMLRDIFDVISYARGKEQITVLIIYTNCDLSPPPTPADLITLQISIFSGSDIAAQEPGWCGFRTIGPCHLVIWYLCPLFTSVELEYFISFSI